MVKAVHTGDHASDLSLPFLTMIVHVQGAPRWWVWFGHRATYQCLPFSRSESEPVVWNLYQSLPPRRRQLTIELSIGVGVTVAGWAGWPTVITVDNGRHSQKATDTMAVGVEKIFRKKFSGR